MRWHPLSSDEKDWLGSFRLSGVQKEASHWYLLGIAYVGFISLGLPDSIAGVAWPSIRDTFDLHQSSFGLIFIGLGCGYCTSGFFGGTLTKALRLGNLLWISSGLVGVAMLCIGFSPAWPMIVVCSAIWGLGSGGIDAGLNAYASNHFSARHMNWMHACYSLGATFGPLIMTAILASTKSWRFGYDLVGLLLIIMTTLFVSTRDEWYVAPSEPAGSEAKSVSMIAILVDPRVCLQIVLFFLYVGIEFTVGQWCYTLLSESRGVRPDIAGILAGGYYASIGIGRILAGIVAHRVSLDILLRGSTCVVLVGAFLFAFDSPVFVSCAGLILTGLGLAPIFPCLMARTPQRLGVEYAVHAIGFQASAGMIGAATVPGLAGVLAETLGLTVITRFVIVASILMLITHELVMAVTRRPLIRH